MRTFDRCCVGPSVATRIQYALVHCSVCGVGVATSAQWFEPVYTVVMILRAAEPIKSLVDSSPV